MDAFKHRDPGSVWSWLVQSTSRSRETTSCVSRAVRVPDARADQSRVHIRSLSAGAIHQTVCNPLVNYIQVCIPPIAEQRRIVAEMRGALATVDQMTRAIAVRPEAIGALSQALVRRAFVDIEAP